MNSIHNRFLRFLVLEQHCRLLINWVGQNKIKITTTLYTVAGSSPQLFDFRFDFYHKVVLKVLQHKVGDGFLCLAERRQEKSERRWAQLQLGQSQAAGQRWEFMLGVRG